MLLGLLFPKLASYHWRQVEVARLLGKLRRREPKVRDGVLFASPTVKLECGAPNCGDLKISLILPNGHGERGRRKRDLLFLDLELCRELEPMLLAGL
jgi:hypothetical protein